jgi:ribose/xylose/arabinose/galactoside ABC-type transport system permease subunit
MREIIRSVKISSQAVSIVAVIAISAVVFSLLQPAYGTWNNLYSVILSATLPAVLSLSMAIVISAGGFDLSIGHVAGFSALMCGYFLRKAGLGTYTAISASVLMCTAIGLINGLLVTQMGISSFIVTLSMQFILVGVRQWITAGDSFRANSLIKAITDSNIAGISSLIVISLAIILLISFIMQKTSFGRKMQFIGSNITASNYCGINVRLYTLVAFVLSGTIAGITGILQFSKLTSATINIGDGWLFNAMTIAVFSSVIFTRFKGFGIVLISLLITMITTGINMLGVSAAYRNFVLGLILLLALLSGKYLKFNKK